MAVCGIGNAITEVVVLTLIYAIVAFAAAMQVGSHLAAKVRRLAS